MAPELGRLVLTTETNSVAVSLDRSIASKPEDYTGVISFKFTTNTLGTAPILIDVPVTARVLPPTLAVTSPDFAPGTSTINFGAAGTQSLISVNNTGQSTLHWTMDPADFAAWYDLTPRGGTVALNESGASAITINRAGLAPGIYSDSFTVQSDGGAQIVTLTIQVP